MPHVISIGSGKGGIGKSVVSANLATQLARKGHKVILLDLDTGGADAHIMFGYVKPEHTLTHFLSNQKPSLNDVVVPIKSVEGLELIVGTGETLYSANMPWVTKQKLLRHIGKLDADYVIIDVGAGTSLHTLDFFLHADQHLCVTSNEPTAILDLYRFIKLAVLRRALSAFLAQDEVSQVLAKEDFGRIEDIYGYADSIREQAGLDARQAVDGFNPGLVVNMAQKDRVSNLIRLQGLLKSYVGVSLPLLGEIPDDNAVRDAVRRYQPVSVLSPQSEAAMALGRLADNVIGRAGIETIAPLLKQIAS